MKNNSSIFGSLLPGLLLPIIQTILIGVIILLINGCKKADETIKKKEQNQTVTTGSVTNISPTSAFSSGNLYSGPFEGLDRRGICYSDIFTIPDVNNRNIESEYFLFGNFSFLLQDLTPGTKYYVRAFVRHYGSDNPIYGQIISFSTTGSITGDIVFNPDLTYGTVADIDGNTYKTIGIGTQTWMAENLKTTKYFDGTDIPNVTDLNAWPNLPTPAYCWYNNDAAAFKKPYGALYNWYTVNTGKLCPSGWHVPSEAEWTTLTTFLGGDSIAGNKLKETGTTHWLGTSANWLIASADVTNSSGFTGLPSGDHWVDATLPRFYFRDLGHFGYFWSSTLLGAGDFTAGSGQELDGRYSYFRQGSISEEWGCSVRCVKD